SADPGWGAPAPPRRPHRRAPRARSLPGRPRSPPRGRAWRPRRGGGAGRTKSPRLQGGGRASVVAFSAGETLAPAGVRSKSRRASAASTTSVPAFLLQTFLEWDAGGDRLIRQWPRVRLCKIAIRGWADGGG